MFFQKLLPWLIIGILLRLLIIPITLHPDIRGYNYGALLISQGHVLDFYDYLGDLPKDDPILDFYSVDLFIYPPLAYLYPAVFVTLFGSFIPESIYTSVVLNSWDLMTRADLAKLAVFLKIPYLVPDLLMVYVLGKFFSDRRDKLLAQIFWLLNPVVIYATYMISQFDILLALSITTSLALAKHNKFVLAAVVLGLGAAVKQSTLFLLPFLALYTPGKLLNKVLVFFSGIAVYIAILLPYLQSEGFRNYALKASLTDKIFYATINISGGEGIFLFLLGLFSIYYFCLLYAKKFELWQWYIWPLLFFFSLVHFHPQWLTWLTPLLVIFMVNFGSRAYFLVSGLLVSYIGMILLFEPSLNIGMFEPLNPNWNIEASLLPTLTKIFPEITFKSIFASLFAASALVISVICYQRSNADR